MRANVVETAGDPARQIDLATDMLGRLALDENGNPPLVQVFRQAAQGFSDLGTVILANQRDGPGRAVGSEGGVHGANSCTKMLCRADAGFMGPTSDAHCE